MRPRHQMPDCCRANRVEQIGATTVSASMPSASAWKFTSIRWRSTGGATARTSSSDTAGRPAAPPAPCRPAATPDRRAGPRPIAPTARTKSGTRSRFVARRPRRAHQPRRVIDTFVGGDDVAHQHARALDLLAGRHRRDARFSPVVVCARIARSSAGARIVDHDVQHEAIELRFRQRIGAFLLDRILRRQHEQRPIELMAHAADRDLILLHRLEQRRLRLRRRAIDLVGQDDVGEDRAGHEPNRCASRSRDPLRSLPCR